MKNIKIGIQILVLSTKSPFQQMWHALLHAESLGPTKAYCKKHIFVSLIVFNETFASKTEGIPHYCVMWHEAIAGRKAPDVVSSYLRMLQECTNHDNVWFWADSCSTQKKNWFLFTGLLQCVNTWGPAEVTIKFLEKGHTFMDSIHGNIDSLFKK